MIDFSKWTINTDYQKAFDAYYKAYIEQFPHEYRCLIEKILLNLEYYDENKMAEICSNYSEKFNEIKTNGCLFTTVIDSKIHNSNAFYLQVQNQDKPLIFQNLYNNDEIVKNNTIIICDDYSGTGGTISDSISYIFDYYKKDLKTGKFITKIKKRITFKKRINNINFVFYPAICTKNSKNNIITMMENKYSNNKYDIYDVVSRSGDILKQILSDEECNLFDKLNDYCKIPKGVRYGFDNCSDLIAMYYGVPNDTIGFLWHNSKKAKAFFKKRKLGNGWFNNTNHFLFNYDDFSFVNSFINNLGMMRGLTSNDKKVLCYVLLGYNKERIKLNNKDFNVEDSINSIINKGYINIDLSRGNKVPNSIYDQIIRYKIGVDHSLESIMIMNLNSYKENDD